MTPRPCRCPGHGRDWPRSARSRTSASRWRKTPVRPARRSTTSRPRSCTCRAESGSKRTPVWASSWTIPRYVHKKNRGATPPNTYDVDAPGIAVPRRASHSPHAGERGEYVRSRRHPGAFLHAGPERPVEWLRVVPRLSEISTRLSAWRNRSHRRCAAARQPAGIFCARQLAKRQRALGCTYSARRYSPIEPLRPGAE